MSTTINNNDASSSSTSTSNNAESFDLRMKSMEDQINNLSLAFTRFMKEPMFSFNTNSRSQRTHDDSDTENEQSDDESSNNVDVPTDYQLSDTLLGQYKHMVNNQGLLVEEECILKKDEISELNKVFNFPSNFQVNVAPFGTPEGITVSSTVKNNDTDLLIVEKRINDSLKPLLLMSSMISSDSSNVDNAIVLAVNAQASLSRVRRNNIAKEIYGSEVLLPIKIKDTPKMFDETETERVRKQDLLLDDAIEQVLPNHYSKRVFYSNVFTVPKPGTTLHRPVLDLKRLLHLHKQPIIQDGRNKESTINDQTRLLHGKTRYQESLPPRISRSTIQRLIPLRVARFALPLENNAVRVINSSSYLYNAVKTCTSNVERYQRICYSLLRRSINRRFNKRRMFIQPQKDNGLTCKTRFQVKSGKECSRTNSITFLGLQIDSVSDDSSSSSSSSSSHVSSSSGNIIDQTISRVNTNPNSTTLETGDYSTFQSNVMSIIRIQKSSTAELLMKSWEPSTLKVYSSSYTRFRNFCTPNSLNPANITLVVFMDYLTHPFKHKPPLAFSTINGHRSMLNQLLLLKNQTDIVNDPFLYK
ncbi:hypothetical protein ACTFIR_012777 [Dictyostelium discoideum]